MLVEGTVAFSNLTKHEEYMGKSTGRYSLVVVLDPSSKEVLEKNGVKLKQYNDTFQRKFASKYPIKIVDNNNQSLDGELPRGSKVRLSVKIGPPSPVHGSSSYLNAVRVVELAEDTSAVEEGF